MKSFFRLVFLSLVLLVVALVSALTAMRFAIHGGEVAVPDLVGKAPAEARAIAEDMGLQVEVERQYYSPTVPSGRILSQLPTAGTKVRHGWDIRVAESLGPQRVQIPSVLGQSQRAAEMNIQRRGLDVGTVAQTALPGSPTDQVVSQSPPPNASDISAPKISLLIATAPPAPVFVMPNFVGQPIGTVTQAVQDAGFKVGTVSMAGQPVDAASASNQAGAQRPSAASVVVSQTPAAGEKVAAGSTVNFEVR